MVFILIIQKDGNIKELNVRDFNIHELYKKCGLKKETETAGSPDFGGRSRCLEKALPAAAFQPSAKKPSLARSKGANETGGIHKKNKGRGKGIFVEEGSEGNRNFFCKTVRRSSGT